MWSTYSKQAPVQKTLVPGDYTIAETIIVPDTTGGIELIPSDTNNTIRFINLGVENKSDVNGDPISVYLGVGFIPTSVLYSNELISGANVAGMQINGQQITAICQSGEEININIQVANAVSKAL